MVALFSDSFRPYVSGVVRSLDILIRHLRLAGHEVYLFCPAYPGATGADQGDPGPTGIFRFVSVPAPTYEGFQLALPFSARITRLLRELRVEVVHTHSPFLMGGLGAFVAWRLGLPLVFTHHTFYHEYTRHYVPFVGLPVRELVLRYVGAYCRRSDRVIAPSGVVRQILETTYELPGEQVVVVPTGVPLEHFANLDRGWLRRSLHLPPEAPVLLYLGRFGREKNVDLLVPVLEHVHAAVPGVHLVLVGDGPEKDTLQAQVAARGLGAWVHFTGLVPPEQVPHYYAGADVFLFPSTTETQGLVVAEAFAAGLPAVAVDAPALREVLAHGASGFLAERSAAALAGRVVQLLRDPALRARMGEQARETARRLSAQRMAARLVEVYKETCLAKQKKSWQPQIV